MLTIPFLGHLVPSNRWPMLLVPLLLCGSNTAQGWADDRADREKLAEIATRYAANRDAFVTIDCRFEAIRGRCESLESAWRGEYSSKQPAQRGHWLVNREHVRYELLCQPEVTAAVKNSLNKHLSDKTTKAGAVAVDCSDSIYLRKTGEYALRYGPLLQVANLFTDEDANAAGIELSPFSLGVMGSNERSNPVRYIKTSLDQSQQKTDLPWDYRLIGIETAVTGRPMLVCELGPGFRVRMGFDPERGHMLVMFSDSVPGTKTRYLAAHVLEARQCPNGAWFPIRAVTVITPDRPGPWLVDSLVVTSLDTERAANPDEFAIDLPAGVQVNRAGHPEWVDLDKAERVTVDGFAELHQRCIAHGREERAREESYRSPQPNPPTPTPSRLLPLLLFNAAVLGLIALVAWLRRRPKEAAPGSQA
jgi:hypothetical protein